MISFKTMLILSGLFELGCPHAPHVRRFRRPLDLGWPGLGSFPGDPSLGGRAARRRRGQARSGLHPSHGARPGHGNGDAQAGRRDHRRQDGRSVRRARGEEGRRQERPGPSASKLEKPGAAVFFVEPQPYWEQAEKKWITHLAKVVVDGYASGEGWDKLAGLPVEIEPLTRPTGLWTGNLFRGIVRVKGKPAPFAEIEVEWANDGSVKAPNEAFITQKIKADQNGVFAYAMPRAGWWGFAALIDGPEAKGPDGKPAKTEIGGLIWVKATDMSRRSPSNRAA